MGLTGILLGLGALVWTIVSRLERTRACAISRLVAALAAGEPLLAHWTQMFMGSAAGFLAQFFSLFLLGAMFGTLMDDSGFNAMRTCDRIDLLEASARCGVR